MTAPDPSPRRTPDLGIEAIRTAIVVAPSPVPLRLGGAERHWEALRRELERRGIAVDLVKLPVREHTLLDLLEGYEAFRLLDLSHADVVISGKYPAWMVGHPNHVVWMLHPLRGLYDTYNPAAYEGDRLPADGPVGELREMLTDEPGEHVEPDPLELIDRVREVAEQLGPSAGDPGGPLALPGPLARAVVHHLDRWALDPSRIARFAAISEVVAARPGYFPTGAHVEVVIPPSGLADPVEPSPSGSGFLAVGRLDAPKRIDLAIDAVRRLSDPAVRLTVVGDGPDRARLEARAHGDQRITFAGRVDDEALRAAYASCRAVIVTPEQEDFGYVAIEALQHGRPVITTTDAGGPTELATDGVDAIVSEPTPAALAEVIGRLQRDPTLAQHLGETGRVTAAAHSWPAAVNRLLAPRTVVPVPPGRRGRIVAVSTYPVAGWPGGGPQRARALLGALAQDGWDVTVLALADPEGRAAPGTTVVADGLTQITVAVSSRHHDAERRLRRLTANVSVTDVTASVLWPSSPELVRQLRRLLPGAAAAVAVQPYLAPAVLSIAPEVPLVLDDHNHERALKSQMLPDDEAGRWMLDRVVDAEGAAAQRAALVVVSTEDDLRALQADHALAPERLAVVTNGVAADAVGFTPPQERASLTATLLTALGAPPHLRHVAVFVGSAHRPNVEAAAVVMRCAEALPNVLFVLAGEHSDQLDPHELGPNVRALGAVSQDRLDHLLAGGSVALNPMRTGGGSNLKLLGYFAAGIPTVTTPLGARGVCDPGRYAVVAPIDRFTDTIAESLAAPDHQRVQRARALVVSEYDWPVLGHRFAHLVQRVTATQTVHEPDPVDPTATPETHSHE